MPKLKWNSHSAAAYKAVGELMKDAGFRALRSLIDADNGSEFTFWSGPNQTMITQTWSDTGDTCYWTATDAPPVFDPSIPGVHGNAQITRTKGGFQITQTVDPLTGKPYEPGEGPRS